MARVAVLTTEDPLLPDRAMHDFDQVLAFHWASPEAAEKIGRPGHPAMRLNDLVPSLREHVERAFSAAHRIALTSPEYRNVRPLQAWENVLAKVLLTASIADRGLSSLASRLPSGATLVFPGRSESASMLAAWAERRGFQVEHHAPDRPMRFGRARARIRRMTGLVREAWLSGDRGQAFWSPLEALDTRYTLRGRAPRVSRVRPGRVWSYASAANYAGVLSKHGGAASSRAQFVANSHAARTVFGETRTQWLWSFGAERGDHASAQHAIAEHVERSLCEHVEPEEAAAILGAPELRSLLARVVPLALAEIDFFHTFFERAEPDELWVANQWGSEGHALFTARAAGVHVTQVQHGLLEQYYACAPLYSDRFLVFGDAWRAALPDSERSRAAVFNPDPPASSIGARADRRAKMLTFFTAPLGEVAFYNPSVARWEAIRILEAARKRGLSITVRVHPRDQIAVWRDAWRAFAGALPPDVRFDKGSPLDRVLEETDVALMYCSTTMLSCAANGIPPVTLGWYPLIWQQLFAETGAIDIAESLEDATRRVSALGRDAARAGAVRSLLAPQTKELLPCTC